MRRNPPGAWVLRIVVAAVAVFGFGAAAWAQSYPGQHGPILNLPEPQTSLTRGVAYGGSVMFTRSAFPAITNIGNIAQEGKPAVMFDLPMTFLQKDDYDNKAIDVSAKGTWLDPNIGIVYPVARSSDMKGRGVLLGQLTYANYKSELDGKGRNNNPDAKFTYKHQAAVLRAGGAYGILEQWSLGAGLRYLAYHKPEGEFTVNKNTTKTSGDPGGGLFELEIGTLIVPMRDLNIGLYYEAGASDNPKVSFKGKNANGAKVDAKEKIYRVFPPRFDLGVAYNIRSVPLQLIGEYQQVQNLEKDDQDIVLRRQSFSLGADYPVNKKWNIRGGLQKIDESGDGKLNLTGFTFGAGADLPKRFDINANLGYYTGKEDVDGDDTQYTDIRLGGQVNYRIK